MKQEKFNPNLIKIYKIGNTEDNALYQEKSYVTLSRAKSALAAEIKQAEYSFDHNEKVIAGFSAKCEYESDAKLKSYYEYEMERAAELNKAVMAKLGYLYACKVYEFSYSLFDAKEVK